MISGRTDRLYRCLLHKEYTVPNCSLLFTFKNTSRTRAPGSVYTSTLGVRPRFCTPCNIESPMLTLFLSLSCECVTVCWFELSKLCERGRWLRQDINKRKCTLCNTNEVGDKCHYICPLFTEDRNSILPTRLCRNPNMYTVQNFMNTVNKRKLVKLCKFISIIVYHVKNPPD